MMNTVSDIDQPLIAIDVVPMSFGPDGLMIGTAKRLYEPSAGQHALPGVLLAAGERLEESAYRALATKAGVSGDQVRHLGQLGAFDGPNRDPRSHAISVAWLAVIDPGAGEQVEWSTSELRSRNLPFDHDDIIDAALAAARTRLWSDIAFTRALTGKVFSTPTAARLEEQLTGLAPHKGNFHRDLSRIRELDRLDEPAATPRGRPATAWRWAG